MKIINIHTRVINQPLDSISGILDTLATPDDKIMAFTKWPAMKLDKGLVVGSKGGHGPIRYTVVEYIERQLIKFEFSKPKGFNGFHSFEFFALDDKNTKIKHTIDIDAVGTGLLSWWFAVRWLHDALLEDSLDKIENLFTEKMTSSKWSLWVRFLRGILK